MKNKKAEKQGRIDKLLEEQDRKRQKEKQRKQDRMQALFEEQQKFLELQKAKRQIEKQDEEKKTCKKRE